VLILAGAALLLENQELIQVGPLWRFWPLIVIGLGIAKFTRAQSREDQGSGMFLALIGIWFLVSVLHLWDLTFHDTWPAVFIAFGASMLWKGLPPMSHIPYAQEHNDGH
jgi:hypothetical protein